MKKKILIAIGVLVGVLLVGSVAVLIVSLLSKNKAPASLIGPDPLPDYITEDGVYFDDKAYAPRIREEHVVRSSKAFYIDDEIEILVYKETQVSDVENLVSQYNGTIVGRMYNYFTIRFEDAFSYEELNSIIDSISEESIVEKAMLSYAFEFNSNDAGGYVPQDRKWKKNWGVFAIRADKAWSNYINDMTFVNVGVYDSSFQENHEDLDFVKPPLANSFLTDESSRNSHGTHVSGILAGSHNKIGIAGIAPKVHLYGASALGLWEQGYRGIQTELMGLIYLLKMNNSRVINISRAYELLEFAYRDNEFAQTVLNGYAERVESLLRALIDEGNDFVICVASGNQGELRKNQTAKRYSAITEEEFDALSESEQESIGGYVGYKPDENGDLCGVEVHPVYFHSSQNQRLEIGLLLLVQ